jgi:ubiquinone/menaquinone biosynthesis C-methylase UbiE
MSRVQSTFCRSAPWRAVARRVVLPWALQGIELHGDVLEVGAGSGAMAAELLASHPDVRLTVTDFDEAMVDVAAARLASAAERVSVRPADATALPFADGSFDAVLSWVMLHHTLEWETALREALRVLRPGGQLVGYDLLSTAPLRFLHRNDDEHIRLIRLRELLEVADDLPVDRAVFTPSLSGLVVRFTLRKTGP